MISIFKKALGSFTSDVDTLPKIFGAIHEGRWIFAISLKIYIVVRG